MSENILSATETCPSCKVEFEVRWADLGPGRGRVLGSSIASAPKPKPCLARSRACVRNKRTGHGRRQRRSIRDTRDAARLPHFTRFCVTHLTYFLFAVYRILYARTAGVAFSAS